MELLLPILLAFGAGLLLGFAQDFVGKRWGTSAAMMLGLGGGLLVGLFVLNGTPIVLLYQFIAYVIGLVLPAFLTPRS